MRPDGYWPQPYSLEMAFGIFRCMLASGVDYITRHRWHTTSVTSLLGGFTEDHGYPRGITSIADLQRRLLQAVFFAGGAEVVRWREAMGVSAYAELTMSFYHYKPFAGAPHLGFSSESSIHEALTALFRSGGKQTAISLNSVHHGARTVHGVELVVGPDDFVFVLTYGFHTPERMQTDGDSEWRYTLAISKPDQVDPAVPEPFPDTLRRALDKFKEIMNPANAHLTTDLIESEFVAMTASVAA